MLNSLLIPLSFGYGVATRVRNALYDSGALPSYRSKLRVISIGNITVGGSGKTPLCIFLARRLSELGKKPVVLLRGYKGRVSGPILIEKSARIEDVGDEALLLAKALFSPVVVARDRVAGAKFIEANNLGDCIILDDGLQHRRLHRDINLVTINVSSDEACELFLEGQLLPVGRLRESRDPALARADVVIFSSRGPARKIPNAIRNLVPNKVPTFESWLVVDSVRAVLGGEKKAPTKAVAVTGIANPQGFVTSIESLGVELLAVKSFADHHRFCVEEISQIRGEYPEAPIIVSAKDHVRMADSEWGTGVFVLETSLKVSNENRLITLLFPH